MARSRHAVWDEEGAQLQAGQWRARLEAAEGNITRAAEAHGISKSMAMRLTRKHALNEFAAELRKKATGHSRGRPWDEK